SHVVADRGPADGARRLGAAVGGKQQGGRGDERRGEGRARTAIVKAKRGTNHGNTFLEEPKDGFHRAASVAGTRNVGPVGRSATRPSASGAGAGRSARSGGFRRGRAGAMATGSMNPSASIHAARLSSRAVLGSCPPPATTTVFTETPLVSSE